MDLKGYCIIKTGAHAAEREIKGALDRLQAQQSNAEPVAWAYFGDFPDGKRLISADNTNLWGSDGIPLYTHPPASTEPRLTVEQAWPYLQHKKGCNMLSFTNSMMSHAPISQRLCDCGLDELRSSLTKAAKP